MKLDLFYAPVACSLVPFLLLEEAGASFEVHVLNLRAGEQSAPAYLSLNPKHKVPLLLVDGVPLSENLAIQTWIARSFPEARLLPGETWGDCQALSLLSWFASGFHPHLSRINQPAKYCGAGCTPGQVTEIATQQLAARFRIAEDLLAGTTWFFDRFTAPDAYFFWCCRRAGQLGVDLSALPSCRRHFEAVGSRASARAVLGFERECTERSRRT
ncbi:glutathione S-transferase family protein [Marinovum sp.]|uniref:glutathione S-transferase family protein n=1 Tax=Marinovum sp. TaxID=2024839 RepID=UPI002B26939C|nr:glutathione S-transferase family protein [Marinovum sp.]